MFLLLHVSVLLQKHGYFTIYSNMLLTYHPQERKYPTKIHPPAKHSLVFQVFIKFMTIFLLFYVLAFWHVGSYLPDQGLNPHSLTLEGEVSTTGPAGKTQGRHGDTQYVQPLGMSQSQKLMNHVNKRDARAQSHRFHQTSMRPREATGGLTLWLALTHLPYISFPCRATSWMTDT